jgi:hypothetical protein
MLSASSAKTIIGFTLAATLTGCTSTISPTAPTTVTNSAPATAPASTIALTIRVLTRGTELPLADVTVLEGNRVVATTDRDGLARAQVPAGVEINIDVRANGFVGFGASGTVTTEERWTFYLEPEP